MRNRKDGIGDRHTHARVRVVIVLVRLSHDLRLERVLSHARPERRRNDRVRAPTQERGGDRRVGQRLLDDLNAAAHAGLGRRRRGLPRSEEHTSELQSQFHLVCRLLLETKNPISFTPLSQKKKKKKKQTPT